MVEILDPNILFYPERFRNHRIRYPKWIPPFQIANLASVDFALLALNCLVLGYHLPLLFSVCFQLQQLRQQQRPQPVVKLYELRRRH